MTARPLAGLLVLGLAGVCGAQTDAPPPAPAAPALPPLPTLDELLGLAPEGPGAGTGALDRLLERGKPAEAFRDAVDLMGESADRLLEGRDPGLATQRLQETALRRLDELIQALEDESRRNQQQQQQQQSQGQPQPRPDAPSRPQQQPTGGDNRTERDPPARQDGPLRPGFEAAPAAWGSLPQRVREMLLQGSNDAYSAAYRDLTEQYYRRLAEDAPARPQRP